MKRSLPKFGARWTIIRPIFPLGVGTGVGRGRACASGATLSSTHDTTSTKMKLRFIAMIYPFG
jgi:hypothetical protein